MPRKEHQLVIVGDSWYRGGAVEKKARSLGLNGEVKFLGYVPRAELPGLFSGATAFVYPSLLEGFGMPIIEAMACGAPVITSNSSALKEVAGGAAVLVDPLSVRELTEAMERVAQDSRLRAELSQKGVRRAAEFSWETTARLTLEAYREAVERAVNIAKEAGAKLAKLLGDPDSDVRFAALSFVRRAGARERRRLSAAHGAGGDTPAARAAGHLARADGKSPSRPARRGEGRAILRDRTGNGRLGTAQTYPRRCHVYG